MCARSFQTVVHGSPAGDKAGLLPGAPIAAVPLAAVTLDFIRGQVLELSDWAPVAIGGVATAQEVEGVVVMKACRAWAARQVPTASDMLLVSRVHF